MQSYGPFKGHFWVIRRGFQGFVGLGMPGNLLEGLAGLHTVPLLSVRVSLLDLEARSIFYLHRNVVGCLCLGLAFVAFRAFWGILRPFVSLFRPFES